MNNGPIYYGNEQCKVLKKIRKQIAELNGIEFEPLECNHKGDCLGTCPSCDDELKYLDIMLQRKRDRGEKIVIEGISVNEIANSKIPILSCLNLRDYVNKNEANYIDKEKDPQEELSIYGGIKDWSKEEIKDIDQRYVRNPQKPIMLGRLNYY